MFLTLPAPQGDAWWWEESGEWRLIFGAGKRKRFPPDPFDPGFDGELDEGAEGSGSAGGAAGGAAGGGEGTCESPGAGARREGAGAEGIAGNNGSLGLKEPD